MTHNSDDVYAREKILHKDLIENYDYSEFNSE